MAPVVEITGKSPSLISSGHIPLDWGPNMSLSCDERFWQEAAQWFYTLFLSQSPPRELWETSLKCREVLSQQPKTVPWPLVEVYSLFVPLWHYYWKETGQSLKKSALIFQYRLRYFAYRHQWLPFGLRENLAYLFRFQHLLFEPSSPKERLMGALCLPLKWLWELSTVFRPLGIGTEEKGKELYQWAEARDCLERPPFFTSPVQRVDFFQGREERFLPPPHPRKQQVIVLAGLPGSGKDTWYETYLSHLPVISLDQIREELSISPEADQRPVMVEAWRQVEELLQQGASFVWNATSLVQHHRQNLLRRVYAYNVWTSLVYLEVPAPLLLCQNRSRSRVVPEPVIWRMARNLDLPSLAEFHQISYHFRSGQGSWHLCLR